MSTIWTFRMPFSSPRLRVGALVVVMSLMLVTMLAACRQSAGKTVNPADWRNFAVVPNSDATQPKSIEDMERIAGFAFAFPSYLPKGMDSRIVLHAWAHAPGAMNGVAYSAGPGEEVIVLRDATDSPYITIRELMKPFANDFPDSSSDVEHVSVAETDVGCSTAVAPNNAPPNPMLQCDWLVGDEGFRTYFQWTVGKNIPNHVTGEMRQQALKVVESMIVAPGHPYTPEAAATLPPAPTAAATDTPVPAATTSVQLPPTDAAVVAPTPVTPGPLGCGDCRVKARDQLRVTAGDVQTDAEGKYFIPDRGDGCEYREQFRGTSQLQPSPGLEEIILTAPGCEATITFVPATGEVRFTIP